MLFFDTNTNMAVVSLTTALVVLGICSHHQFSRKRQAMCAVVKTVYFVLVSCNRGEDRSVDEKMRRKKNTSLLVLSAIEHP